MEKMYCIIKLSLAKGWLKFWYIVRRKDETNILSCLRYWRLNCDCRFWETLAYIANTLIFIIVGMVIAEKAIFEIHGIDWFYMFALYFGIFVIRFVSLYSNGPSIIYINHILRHLKCQTIWMASCNLRYYT